MQTIDLHEVVRGDDVLVDMAKLIKADCVMSRRSPQALCSYLRSNEEAQAPEND